MADLVLREADLWVEIVEIQALISSGAIDIRWLWEKAAQHDRALIQSMLDEVELLPEGFWNRVDGIRLIALPDDLLGTVHRLWLRRKPYPQDWAPRKR